MCVFILSLAEKRKITVSFVKQGPFRDVPALTTQKERENQGKWEEEKMKLYFKGLSHF